MFKMYQRIVEDKTWIAVEALRGLDSIVQEIEGRKSGDRERNGVSDILNTPSQQRSDHSGAYEQWAAARNPGQNS